MYGLQSVLTVAGIIPDLALFLICVSYMARSGAKDSKLLFTGSLLHILVRLFYLVIPYFTTRDYTSTDYSIIQYYQFAGIVSLLGAVIFCYGLALLIQRVLSFQKAKV